MSTSAPQTAWEPAYRLVERIAMLVSSRIDAADMARSALEALLPPLGAHAAAIYRVHGEELVLHAQHGLDTWAGLDRLPTVLPAPEFTSQPPVRQCTAEDAGPAAAVMLERAGLRVVAACVLTCAGARVGVVYVARRIARPFDEAELSLLCGAAALLGPGIAAGARDAEPWGSGRELAILQRVSTTLGRSLDLDAILQCCLGLTRELTGADVCAIFIDDGDGGPLRLAAHHHGDNVVFTSPPPRSPLCDSRPEDPRIVFEEVDQLVEPYRGQCRALGLRMTACLPLLVERTTVGLVLLGFRHRQRFSHSTVRTLRALAEQQAVAIDRARAHALAGMRAHLLEAVRCVSEKALVAPTSTAIYDAILDGLVAVTGIPSGRLSIIDEEGDLCTIRVHNPPPALAHFERLPFNDSGLRLVQALDGPCVFRSAEELPADSFYTPFFKAANAASLLLIPLRRGERVVGALSSLSLEPRSLHPEELEAFSLLASAATSALEADALRRQAAAQRSRLEQIIDSLPVAMMVVDRDGRIEQLNAKVRVSAHRAAPGAPWQTALDATEMTLPSDQPIRPEDLPLQRALHSEEPAPAEIRLRTARGWRNVIVNAVALRDDRGRVSGAVATAQDVTALRELADSRDRFLRMATHELSNPIASLQGVVNRLALDRAACGDRVKLGEYIVRMRRQVDRMIRLIHDLHDVERLRDGTLRLLREQVDLVKLAREMIEPPPPESHEHVIRLEAPPSLVGNWDRVRLAQVLTNLLTNAIRYSPEGGAIVLGIEPHGAEVLLSVRDPGIGIPVSHRRHLFEPGFRGREAGKLVPGGSGLGLYITNEIVRRHGGRIELESEPGRGSCFLVWLPREPPPEPPTG